MAWNRVNKDYKLVSSTPQVCVGRNVDPYAFFPVAEPDMLYYAFNDIEQIKDCIRYGYDFEAESVDGLWTPLQWYCANASVDAVIESIDNGRADVNHQTRKGDTALHRACQLLQPSDDLLVPARKTITALLARGASVNTPRISDGKTPLHLACEANDWRIIDLLIRKHADMNATTKDRETPLMIATTHNIPDVLYFFNQIETMTQCINTLLLGHHKRCGRKSLVYTIPGFVLEKIVKKIIQAYYQEWDEYAQQEEEFQNNTQ